MHTNTTNSKKGFTIIEVLIVLAIAGLIMLIVFLAVPALNRNSRNAQRRSDAANYAAAVNEFVTNNNGRLPSTAAHVTSVNSLAKMGSLTPTTGNPIAGNQGGFTNVDQVRVVVQAVCDTATVGETNPGSARRFVVQYAVENSSGTGVPQCLES